MYALDLLDEYFIFDSVKSYGFIKKEELNKNDFIKVLDLCCVLDNYINNHDNNVYQIEEYSSFLFRICLMYLKD